MKMKLTRKQIRFRDWLETTLKEYKSHIDDDMKDHDDDLPYIQITIGSNEAMEEFAFQSGDNSYTGACYHFPIWNSECLYRRSNCKKLASSMLNNLINS